jgi:chromosome segregation ATPase
MRLDSLDGSLTGMSNVLLDRARTYLTGDEVFEELYRHAVQLEKDVDEGDDGERIDDLQIEKKALFKGAREAVKDLTEKHKAYEAAVRRLVDLNDKLSALADKCDGTIADGINLKEAIDAIHDDLDDAIGDIPDTQEPIDELQGVIDDTTED